ncbi:MAG: hypothetical protein A3F17_04780 [Gammaproteobacteria bacterium RIFCSPHIGHO2_12_FULL_41_15]|nr:MAG: hypothetical protein A3F17_04780 [Gammaproteobacteria bacterium RIFCSPHIGHO2_12_FULL_41_15]
MTKTNLKKQYLAIKAALKELGITDQSPSELHGLMAGFLTYQPQHKTYQAWEDTLLNETLGLKLLEQLFEVTRDQINDTEFSMQMLIPDDDAPVQERALSIVEWTEGYVSGLGQNEIQVTEQQKMTLDEGLENLIEITKLDFLSIENNEMEDGLLTEIEEFVRATAMLFVEELAVPVDEQVDADNRTLH